MFTGIVEELGEVVGLADGRLRVAAATVLADATIGASIAVNGCCLTVVHLDVPAVGQPGIWEADLSGETLARTGLGDLRAGDVVNLERPLAADGRFGGHVVQGHVDGVGTLEVSPPDLRIAAPEGILRYLVPKGSVTVDGVSLTVVDVDDAGFTVAVIPHTAAVTTLGHKPPGSRVNLEVDVLAKYVERLLGPYRQ